MYPENNSSNSQTASLAGMLFNHRRFAPWYDDRADYNTDAKSYYDYLARTNKLLDAISDLINQLLKREIEFSDTTTIDFTDNGGWDNVDKIIVSAEAVISKLRHGDYDNAIYDDGSGLFAKDFTDDIEKLKEQKPIDYQVDFSKTPFYYGDLASIQQTVAQSVLMASNNDIYLVQSAVNDAPDGERHATINHLTPAGIFIDKMEILHSGHGSGWKLIEDNDKISFILTGKKAGAHKTVVIDYQPNARLEIFSDSVSSLPNDDNLDNGFMIDIENNKLGAIFNNNGYQINLYAYNDFMSNGFNAKLIKNIKLDIKTLQGSVITGNKIYIYNSTVSEDDQYILEINVDDEATKKYPLGRLGQDPILSYNQVLEGEDIIKWVNPKTNEISYMIAVATGFAGGTQRTINLYMWNGPDNELIFNRLFNEKIQSIKFSNGDGSAITFDEQPNNLSDILAPGYYYFNSGNFNKFSDKPTNYNLGASGFYLFVTPNNKQNIVLQELIRLTSSGRNMRFYRTVDTRNNQATDWIYNDGYADHTIKPVSPVTLLSNINEKGEYYLNTGEWGNLTDVPQDPEMGYGKSGFFVTVSQKNTNGHVIQECLQNSTVSSPVKLVRTVFSETEASQWLIIKNSEA